MELPVVVVAVLVEEVWGKNCCGQIEPSWPPEASDKAWPSRPKGLLLPSIIGMPAALTAALVLTPNCLAMERSISAMRTFSITCSPPATDSMLMTFLGSPVKLAARLAARPASIALETLPDSTILSAIAVTLIEDRGIVTFIRLSRSPVSRSTRMSSDSRWRP